MVMVVMVMVVLSFAFRLLRPGTATVFSFISGLTAARMRVEAALPSRFRFSVGGQSDVGPGGEAAVVGDAAVADVTLAEASVSFVTEGDVGDAGAERRQVRAVGADLHEQVLAEVHRLVAAAAQVHGAVAARERRGRRGGGGLGAGLGRARTSGRRRAVRFHHHWRGAASAAGARASPHHAPATLAPSLSYLNFYDRVLHLYYYGC